MSTIMAVLIALIVLMIIGALISIETSNLLFSIVSLGAVGFLLSIVFLFLSAPDLAITQLAVEVITLVILLRVTLGSQRTESQRTESQRTESQRTESQRTESQRTESQRTESQRTESQRTESQRPKLLATATVVSMMFVLVFFGARMFNEFPEFGDPVMDRFTDAPSRTYLREGLEKTGAANVVTAVLLDFRGYDTLGEATVLFCAVMGALSILRRKAKKPLTQTDEEGSS